MCLALHVGLQEPAEILNNMTNYPPPVFSIFLSFACLCGITNINGDSGRCRTASLIFVFCCLLIFFLRVEIIS